AYLNFMALISISLGILNLLPIPMLDGGHLLFYAIEAARKGKPLSEQAMSFAYLLGWAYLALLMGLAFYNDFVRLLSGHYFAVLFFTFLYNCLIFMPEESLECHFCRNTL